jgi:hypothetical protein
MTDGQDPFERRFTERLSHLSETPLPGRRSNEHLAAAAMTDARTPWRVIVLGAAVLVAAVATMIAINRAPPGVGSQSTVPSASTTEPSGISDPAALEYSCGGGPSFTPRLFNEPEFDLTSIPAGAALADFINRGADGGLLPPNDWRLVDQDDSSVWFVAPVPGDPYHAYAKVEPRGDHWRVTGYGGCRPEVEMSGLNSATWWLAPGQRINEASTSFLADVTEDACASGQSSKDRLRPPLITYEADRVVVVFTVEPLSGAQECPSNPSTEVRVELSQPLGERQLLDGGTLPWRDASSPDS